MGARSKMERTTLPFIRLQPGTSARQGAGVWKGKEEKAFARFLFPKECGKSPRGGGRRGGSIDARARARTCVRERSKENKYVRTYVRTVESTVRTYVRTRERTYVREHARAQGQKERGESAILKQHPKPPAPARGRAPDPKQLALASGRAPERVASPTSAEP